MKSYRFTNKKSAMSDLGHAMFADDRDMVTHYGVHEYTICHALLTNIEDLELTIRETIADDIETGIVYNYLNDNDFADIDAFVSYFNPADIIDAAEGYDAGEFATWLYERVLEPNDIFAVKTKNGAVVFDEALIVKVEDEAE